MRDIIDINSNDNALFVTALCNNRCLMCCQPPLLKNDIEVLYKKNLKLIKSAPKNLPVLALTGGEPTILGDRLFDLIKEIRQSLPETDIHILTNGRAFKEADFAHRLAAAGEGKITVGVPLHSDYGPDHDLIAGAKNAYQETILGLYNLASEGIAIELRIVINAMNYQRLPQMAEFIFKNLPFVSWTAFMGMELIGYAEKNHDHIWIEPIDYVGYLEEAVLAMADWDLDVEIYNIPLCLLPESLHPVACKSISDWKNKYLDICNECSKKNDCCGLFATSKEPYEGLHII